MKSAFIGTVAALLVVVALGFGCGLFGPAVGPAIDCSVRILDDALAGMTIAQIEADVLQPCGADVAAIIAVLLGNSRDDVHATKAYAESLRVKMQILGGDSGAR